MVWFLLQRTGRESATAGARRLNYDDFTQAGLDCRELVGPHADLYFQPSAFLRLARDADGAVPAASLFRYLAARSTQLHLWAELGRLDAGGSGSLSPQQLATFLEACAPITELSEQLVSVADWVVVVQARLVLLHGRRGRLLLRELVGSPAMLEVMQLLDLLAAEPGAATEVPAALGPWGIGGSMVSAGTPPGTALPQLQLQDSWASPAAVARLRAQFLELDLDGDGQLSQAEFSR